MPAFKKHLPGLLILPAVALLLSAFMTWANVGLGGAFLATWARNFVVSLAMLPLILVGIGGLERVAQALFPTLRTFWRKLMVSLVTACVIESVLALVISAINSPWDATFSHFWWRAFSRSIPVGLVIGLFMGFYMKPKLEQLKASAAAA